MTNFVFIVSNGRSGSTLVQEVLCRHAEVGFVSNLDDRVPWLPSALSRWNSPVYRRLPPSFTRKGRARFAPSEGYRILDRQVSPMLESPCRDLVAADAQPLVAEPLRRFFEERAAVQRKDVLLHKFTGWPRSGLLHAVFPDARFIHVVRDGRDVASSDLRVSWWPGYLGPEHLGFGPLPERYLAEWHRSGESFAVLAAISWKMVMAAFAEARAEIPAHQWMDIRFEDVLQDPRQACSDMLKFMGLHPGWQFERELRRVKVQRDRRQVYRSHFDEPTVRMLEDCLAEELERWGYR